MVPQTMSGNWQKACQLEGSYWSRWVRASQAEVEREEEVQEGWAAAPALVVEKFGSGEGAGMTGSVGVATPVEGEEDQLGVPQTHSLGIVGNERAKFEKLH
jgi:hypothetical protein